MRYLVIADVHANLEALDAVLADSTNFEAVICLGDIVGYGASPNECVERVRGLPNLISLVGNHDLAALGAVDPDLFNDYARDAALWTARTLRPESRSFLSDLEPSRGIPEAFLAHASPRDPVWEYLEDAFQGPPNFVLFDQDACLVGHTHVPRVFSQTASSESVTVSLPRAGEILKLEEGTRYILNPGGVGQPRDRDPRAAYAMYDTASQEFTFCRVPYDVEGAQRRIEAAGLPEALALRLSIGV